MVGRTESVILQPRWRDMYELGNPEIEVSWSACSTSICPHPEQSLLAASEPRRPYFAATMDRVVNLVSLRSNVEVLMVQEVIYFCDASDLEEGYRKIVQHQEE